MENYDNLCYITKIWGILSYFVLYILYDKDRYNRIRLS